MSGERADVVLSPFEHRELDRVARGLRRDDPELAGLLTTGRPRTPAFPTSTGGSAPTVRPAPVVRPAPAGRRAPVPPVPSSAPLSRWGSSGRGLVVGVVLATVVLGGAGIVVTALGVSGGGIGPVLVGAGLIGSCFAAITWLTADPRDHRPGRQAPRTARRAARAPSVWSRSRWRR